ncbi:MAG: C25 family cysteine peptidase [Candidatus Cloacimonetes bacterium]|nr:C25 family cysteine peptidase [Candidatus Cloacimonadota bacterium]
MNKMLFLALLLCALPLLATVSHPYALKAPQIDSSGEYTRIILPGALPVGEPGQPALPWIGTKLLLPPGTQASRISVERSEPVYHRLEKALEPIQPQYPLSLEEAPETIQPDPAIYAADQAWPATPHTGPATHFLSGHPISVAAVCPFDYNPVSGELVFYSRITVTVETASASRAAEALPLLKQDAFTAARVQSAVDNPGALPRYDAPTAGYEYLIIHDAAKESLWLPLKALYEARGMNVLMKSIQTIYAESTGATNPEKIRNYLISLYAANSLRHLFLAGDTDVIPHRGLYAASGSYTDADIPADIYYASLDGNWNADGDANWGEIGEADLIPEFAVGRFCYNSDAEIANFLAKLTHYLNTPEENEAQMALFLGEKLSSDPLTWGGNYMDELIGGSSANTYSTTGIPTTWANYSLYDRDLGSAWNETALFPLLSQGYNFVNHLGHANTTYGLRLYSAEVDPANISNDGAGENYSLIFTQGCYSGNFASECVAEKFTSIPTAAVAMFANSRYGWYAPASTNSSSQHFHRQYLDAIFGEGVPEIGSAINDARIDLIPFTQHSGVMHWCHYEITLFGDPALKAWTDTPQTVSAQLPDLWLSGLDHYLIQTNSPGANLRIKAGANFLYETTANASGLLYLHLPQVIAPGSYDLYITAPNRYPHHSQITFQASAEPYLSVTRTEFLDSDGLHHSGELIPLTVTLKNTGLAAQANPGTLSLSSFSPYLQILGGSHAFPALAAGDSLVIADVFSLQVGTGFADLEAVQVLITASFDALQSQSHAWLNLNAPILALTGYQAQNPGWQIRPGDSPSLDIQLANTGSGHAFAPLLQLSCASPHAQLSSLSPPIPPLAPGSAPGLSAAFSLEIYPSAPLNAPILVEYTLSAESGPASSGEFLIYVSETGYHFENSLMGFASLDLDPGYYNQWHREPYRNHSANGACALKFGGPGPEFYEDSSYGALESPSFRLGAGSELRFFHWMDAEAEWDGGLLMLSLNGGDWFQLTPVGGYNSFITDNPASPFAAGTLVWSGSFGWTEAVFDLSAYSGDARFRWVFGSDGALSYEGWYIDDIVLTTGPLAPPQAPANLSVQIAPAGFQLSWTAVTQDTSGQPLTPNHYYVYRSETPSGPWSLVHTAEQTSWLDETALTRAFYQVSAVKL